MFKNYLVTAFNNLLKNRLYTLINITGLAVGLAACILIALYVQDETSYDKHWQDAGRIYRVNQGTSSNLSVGSSLLTAPALQQYFSPGIEAFSRLSSTVSDFEAGELSFQETVYRADPSFTDIFDLDILAGNLSANLANPGNIALNREVAESYFDTSEGLDELIGRVLSITSNGVTRDFRISAIYGMPGNSILELPALTVLDEAIFSPQMRNWGALTVSSYIKLSADADPSRISARLPVFTDETVDISFLEAGPDVSASDRVQLDLQPITEAHLNTPFDTSRAGGNRTTVIAFSAIAVLVLLIGTINYTILSTARATKRAREVAMRKTVGASKQELITQFLGESFCLVFPALILSFALVEMLLPVFETMVGKSLIMSWTSVQSWFSFLGLYVAVSLLGGLYPAFVLSHFRPGTLMKGSSTETRSSKSLRNILVVFQFGISIALIIATGVIYAQVRYAITRDPGFNRENIVVIENFLSRPAVGAARQALKQEILNLGNVTAASYSTHQPTQKRGMANVALGFTRVGEESNPNFLGTLAIDYDFFDLYETDLVAGRTFVQGLDQEAEIFARETGGPVPTKVVINETAARQLGFSNPDEAINNQLQMTSVFTEELFTMTIIGFAADTNFYNLNAPSRAEIYSLSPGFTDVLSIKYTGSRQALMEQIGNVWREVMGDEQLSTGFVSQNMAAEFTQEQTEARMLISFSLLAVIIACLGLYGSSTFNIERRTKEIGIRKVMGAEVREIVTLLMWQFSKPVLIANIIAWPAALWAMLTWLQRFPYQIDTLLLIPLCVLAGFIALSIAWLTVAGNTVKVATTNPVYALRYE